MKAAKVLIIEDDAWFAEQHRRTLEGAGFTVRLAADGVAGIDAIDAETPDALVIDMFLPGPNALVLLHELQSHSDLAKIPVVICSNSTVDLDGAILGAYGIKSVLDKGAMRPEDLVAAVKRELL